MSLKGTVLRDFLLQVFSWFTLPQAPENNIRVISKFFENSRRYSQVKVHHRCLHHRCLHHRCQKHRWQILPPVPLVLLIPVANVPPVPLVLLILVANVPPVSTIPAANLPPVATCHWYQRHRRLIMGTISGCRHLKVSLRAKIYIYVNSTSQRCQNKIIKIFLLEGFFHSPPVSTTRVMHLEPRISPQIFEKICYGCNGILRCLGETDSWKKPEVENLVTLSL